MTKLIRIIKGLRPKKSNNFVYKVVLWSRQVPDTTPIFDIEGPLDLISSKK